jgi:hypothetical protein
MKVFPHSRVTLDSSFTQGQALARLQEATAPRRRLETFRATVSADRFSLKVPGTRGAAFVSGTVSPSAAGSRIEAEIKPRGPAMFVLMFWWVFALLWLKDELLDLYLTGGMNMWVWLYVGFGALYHAIFVHAWRQEEQEARELLRRVFQDSHVYFDRY